MRKITRLRSGNKNRLYYIFGIVTICAFISIGIGYSILTSTVRIDGTASITSTWKIVFTKAVENTMNEATTTSGPSITGGTTLDIGVELNKKGSQAIYDVTVQNQGTIDAVVKEIRLNDGEPSDLNVYISGLYKGFALKAGESKQFQVIAEWSASAPESSETEKDVNVSIDFEQETEGSEKPELSMPTYTVDYPNEVWTKEKNVTMTYPEGENLLYQYSTDGGKTWLIAPSRVYVLKFTTEGTLYIRVSDGVSVLTTPLITIDKIDTTAPEVQVNGNNSEWTTSKTLTIHASDKESGLVTNPYSWDGGKAWTSVKEKEFTSNQTVNIWVKDNVGNINKQSIIISKIDRQPPVISDIENTSQGNWTNQSVTLSWDIIEEESGLKQVEYSYDGKEFSVLEKENWYEFASDTEQDKTIYIRAIDNVSNVSEIVSSSIKIDKTDPIVNDIILTPDDDSLTITVDAFDTASGVYSYYYSKDGGQEYIESKDANYTFTSLEEKDYLVSVYVKDKAGNKSEPVAKSTTIRYAPFCEQNGIKNLSDCIISVEANNANLEEAKKEIESKGAPNFRVTSPNVLYQEKHATSTSTFTSNTYHNISTAYTFDESTGVYTLTNPVLTDPEALDFSSGQVYYTCQTTNLMCTTMYEITGLTTSTDEAGAKIYKMTKYDYSASVGSYDNSESGLYATPDADGTSYYYRGAVAGNYVKLNNQYYRVIRVNGDGTLRIIYDGTTPHENGESSNNRQVGTSAFNPYYSDNGYVGYMYGDMSQNTITEGENTWDYVNLSATTKYYFGTSYSYDKAKNAFTVTGDGVTATLEEYGQKYNDKKYYTCFSPSKKGTCQRLLHVQKYVNETQMSVKSVESSSTSYNQAHQNINNSTLKTYLENWYTNNLSGVDNKISKTTYFCNNRQVSTRGDNTYKNTGYGNTPTLYGYTRFYDWNGSATGPTLTCQQANDKFTTSSSTGNGKLTKPVGLITADEVNMAGGKSGSRNMLYYLYSGTDYWTMSPSYFVDLTVALELRVTSSGVLGEWDLVTNSFGVRPVINLDTKNLTFTGTGTMQDPYVIK